MTRTDFRGLLFAALFCCLANALFGQQNNSDTYPFHWKKDNYALRYEVLIEREEDGEYNNIWQEFTEDTFIVFLPPPGNYRWRVIQYDIFGLPGKGSEWKTFVVLDSTAQNSKPQLVMDVVPLSLSNQEEDTASAPPEPVAVQTGIVSRPPPVVRHKDIFIAPFAEGLGYSRYSAAFGGGIVFGGSFNGMGIGLSLLYAQDAESFISLEGLAHFRLYLSRVKNNTGFFLQAEGGIVLFSFGQPEITEYWSPSAGLSAGWRFPFGKDFYVEPVIRGGYPYLFGVSLSAGLRFH